MRALLPSGRLFVFLIVFVALLLTGCASQKSTVGSRETIRNEEMKRWVEETLKRLSLEEKVAQMVVPKASGLYASSESDEWKRLVHLVKERKVGGVAVFQGDVYETAIVLNRLQEMADVPLLVGCDFERGLAMRTRRTTAFPEAMALGATKDPRLAYEMGRIVAEEARAIGVHQNYAPVADVNINPENPVINVRSYGEDPTWVAEIAAAFAAGLQSGGVIATAKHFPGHGDTNVDSHLGLPVLNVSRARLDSVELVPFRRLIDQGVNSVMIAHIAVPAIEPDKTIPATLSPAIVSGLLKGELHFHGLVVCDAIDMQGLLNGFGLDEAVVRLVAAGIDLLIVPPADNDDGVIVALKNAVAGGRLMEARIDSSVRKILALKASLSLDQRRTVDLAHIAEVVGTPDHWDVARAVAREAITVMKNDNVLPLQRIGLNKRILNVIISDNEDYRTEVHRTSSYVSNERFGDYFIKLFRIRFPNAETIRLDPRANKLDFDSVLVRAKKADMIVCPVFVRIRSGSGKFGLPLHLVDFANLLASQGKPVVFVALGSPYVLGALKNGLAYICSYSDGELATEATVEALFGEIPVRGYLPVTISGMFQRGSGLEQPQYVLREDSPARLGFNPERLGVLDTIMRRAIDDSAFPGAQLLVAKDGAIVYNSSFGWLEYSQRRASVDKTTLYDLASLTKVIATTSALMKLYDEGKLKLDQKVANYLPEFGNHGKEHITITDLLLHNSGLPAFKRFYLTCKTKEEVLDSIYNSELIYSPGDSTLYSDLGFITLGKVAEKISGMTLDRYMKENFSDPLGMTRTMFNPPEGLWNNVAPTEQDTIWRRRLVRGTVHDETASLLGGVAGHAGLFSTASDLAIYMQMLMNGGNYAGKQYLKPETVRLFTAKQGSKSSRAFGWDTKTADGYSSAGSWFSEKSFGHTGFTGTSIWSDPDKNLFVIFLTNRVHPTRENTKIYKVRPAVHDAVVKALSK